MPSHISEDYIMAQKEKKSVLRYRFDLPFISHESFVKMDRGKMIFGESGRHEEKGGMPITGQSLRSCILSYPGP